MENFPAWDFGDEQIVPSKNVGPPSPLSPPLTKHLIRPCYLTHILLIHVCLVFILSDYVCTAYFNNFNRRCLDCCCKLLLSLGYTCFLHLHYVFFDSFRPSPFFVIVLLLLVLFFVFSVFCLFVIVLSSFGFFYVV